MTIGIDDPVVLVCGVLVVLCAWWLFFGAQQNYWLDRTRQELFAIRNELFDAAAAGQISFDDPAYILTRSTLNGMIRFAHQLNILYVLVIFLAHKFVFNFRRSSDYQQRFDAAVGGLSEDNQRLIKETVYRAHWLFCVTL